jgi:putative tryptophan/tyrosine transport system substrate-binding protein
MMSRVGPWPISVSLGLAAFQQGLQQSGWVDGRNLRIELRRGAGDAENIRKLSAELAALAPDVIVALGSSTVGQLSQASW